jgi:RNA recognition motif-containing protein
MEQMSLIPPTREEVMRTIFVGKISPAITDKDLERILRAAGSLRRWTRAYDVNNKPCTFGFAEYEDAESLETAAEVLPDVEVPAKKLEKPEDKLETKEEENGEENGGSKTVEKVKLLVRMPSIVRTCNANMSARSKSTKPRRNMLKNGERSAERTNPHFSSESTLQTKHLVKFLPACSTLPLPCRQMEMSRWTTWTLSRIHSPAKYSPFR